MGGPNLSGEEDIVRFYLEQLRNDRVNVHTIHAETEGMAQIGAFTKLIRALKGQGARVLGDGEPKIGAHGKPVLFLHPKDFNGTLVELEQA